MAYPSNSLSVSIERTVLKAMALRPEFAVLQSVPGIGKILALTIMLETGDIGRFAGVGNYASYCRCVKSERLSNDKKKGEGNRKSGNKYLSWAFSEAAHFCVRLDTNAKRYFERKRQRTNAMVAIRAVAHKLARACYYLLRDQVPYESARLFAR